MSGISARPKPFVLEFTEFWWSAAREGRLLVQRCGGCGALRHPPSPACPACRSFEWDAVESAGRGVIHSYTVSHHPQHPAFEYPLIVALITLEEGTRLVVSCDIPRDDVRIGLPVQVEWFSDEEGVALPTIRARSEEGRDRG